MEFAAIGTQWSIETKQPIKQTMRDAIMAHINEFDQTYSRFRDDSLVSQLARTPGTYVFPRNVQPLIEWYRQLYTATASAVTPLVGDTLTLLGYDKTYSFQKTSAPVARPVLWEEVMQWRGSTVTTTRPVVLDFGAAGKGYLVDSIGALLEQNGVLSYVIDASGDIRHRGDQEQVIGLEDPRDPTRVIGTMPLHGRSSICASATNRRIWGNGLHHVIDGRTGQPTKEIIATWVMHASTMVADGLSTALFFAHPQQLQAWMPFQFVRMGADGAIEHSPDYMGELFT